MPAAFTAPIREGDSGVFCRFDGPEELTNPLSSSISGDKSSSLSAFLLLVRDTARHGQVQKADDRVATVLSEFAITSPVVYVQLMNDEADLRSFVEACAGNRCLPMLHAALVLTRSRLATTRAKAGAKDEAGFETHALHAIAILTRVAAAVTRLGIKEQLNDVAKASLRHAPGS